MLHIKTQNSQRLVITPQLQQAIRLLQLSNVQLQNEIQQALESNIMLEIAEESTATEETENKNLANETTAQNDKTDDFNVVTESENIPDQLPIDNSWETIYSNSSNENHFNSTPAYNNLPDNLENQENNTTTLQQHLLWQLNLSPTSDIEKVIAIVIIDSIDENGYLNCPLNNIRTSLQEIIHKDLANSDPKVPTENQKTTIKLNEIETVLNLIQSLEPAGVGARNLSECLLIQLNQYAKDTDNLDIAIALISKHSHLLLKRDFNQIMKKLKIDQATMKQTMDLIQSMNPLPGKQIQETRTEYITPDVYAKKRDGLWYVELNPELAYNIRINNAYANITSKSITNQEHLSLKSHLQEAKSFIRNLHKRNATLLNVTTCIVQRQKAFLDQGEEFMQPMVLSDIAETLQLHETTISRATMHKYIHTPIGIFGLNYFFSSNLNNSYGVKISSVAIRAKIKNLITAEPQNQPLSDAKISALLLKNGTRVSRRTVTKYRLTMGIPPANKRKRIA